MLSRSRERSRELRHAAAGAVVIVVVAAGMWRSGLRQFGYPAPVSGLRGGASLHLPASQAATYRVLARSIQANCTILFTFPRQHSLNLWSGVPSPEGTESIPFFQLIALERQRHILQQLESDPGACAVYHPGLLDFWQATAQDMAQSPLADYVIHGMTKIAEAGDYQIRVNPGRKTSWVAASNP